MRDGDFHLGVDLVGCGDRAKKQAAHAHLRGAAYLVEQRRLLGRSLRSRESFAVSRLVAAARLGRAAARFAADRLAARLVAAALHAIAQVAEGTAAGLAAGSWLAAARLGRAAGRFGLAAGRLAAARFAALLVAAAEHVAQAAAGLAAGGRLAARRSSLAAARLATAWFAAAVRATSEHAVKHLERLGLGRMRQHKQGGQRRYRQNNTRSHGEGSFTGHTT